MVKADQTSWWLRVERRCLHPQLYEDPSVLVRARLMLYTAAVSAVASVPLLTLSFTRSPEIVLNHTVLTIGHLLYSATFLLLPFFPTLTVPVMVMMIVATLQLINGAIWFGGLDSIVIYAYPVAPVFFALLGRAIHGVIGALALSMGLIFLYVLEQRGVSVPGVPAARDVELLTLLWLTAIGLGIAVVSTRLFEQITGQLKSELKQRTMADEDAKKAQNAKDWFIAYFSHEIRTPISVIAGSIDLMEHNTDRASQARQFKALRSASRGMVRLMDDLIDMSALETGQLSLLVERMDVRQLIDDIGQEFTLVAQQKGLTIKQEYADEPVWVRGDVQRLRQILANLVENGLKYTVTGGVALSLDVQPSFVRVCISDTGPGIAESDRRFIFEPYARATESNIRGSGLGLTISRRLLQQMGTDLLLESALGEGSSFWFDLPVDVG